MSFEESLEYARVKEEEKWSILSLDICRQELKPHYALITEIVKKAKKTKES